MYPNSLKDGEKVQEDLDEEVFIDKDLPSPGAGQWSAATANMPGNTSKESTVGEEWQKPRIDQACSDASQQMEGEPSTVVQCQPRATSWSRLSEANVFLQPLQLGEMLSQSGGVVSGNNSTSSVLTGNIHSTISEQCNSAQPSKPLLPVKPSLWGELSRCTWLFGTSKSAKHASSKKDEWEISFADIRELDFIGSGSQGAVFVGEYLREKVAVKKVKDVSYCEAVRCLIKLRHPNIVKFK